MLILKDLQDNTNCESCGANFRLPTRPGPRAVALKTAEERGRFLCRLCRSVARTTKYNKSARGKQKRREHDINHQEKRVAATRRWRHNNPERRKELDRKYLYGLTPETHKQLCEKDPVCAICGSPNQLKIDHNHDTQKVRGRLCCKCNTALGKFGDGKLLFKAVEYIRERDYPCY